MGSYAGNVSGTSLYDLYIRSLVNTAGADPRSTSLYDIYEKANAYLDGFIRLQTRAGLLAVNCFNGTGDPESAEKVWRQVVTAMKAQVAEFQSRMPSFATTIQTVDQYAGKFALAYDDAGGQEIFFSRQRSETIQPVTGAEVPGPMVTSLKLHTAADKKQRQRVFVQ